MKMTIRLGHRNTSVRIRDDLLALWYILCFPDEEMKHRARKKLKIDTSKVKAKAEEIEESKAKEIKAKVLESKSAMNVKIKNLSSKVLF